MNSNLVKVFFLTTFFILYSLSSNAQVNQIKDGADKNKSKPKEKGSSSSPDGCGGPCLEGCFNGCTIAGASLAIAYHAKLLETKDENPLITSVDVMLHTAYEPSWNSMTTTPRIHGTWGLFGTDFRMCMINDMNYGDFYRTIDWNVIQLNLIAVPEFTLRLGTGFMYDQYAKEYYGEQMLGMEFNYERKYHGTFEIRYADNYDADLIPRIEMNLRTDVRFYDDKNISIYGTVGGLYQKYFSDLTSGTTMWSIQTGLRLNYH